MALPRQLDGMSGVGFNLAMVVPPLPDLTKLSSAEKDALIVALWQQVVALTARVEALEQRLNAPPKTPDRRTGRSRPNGPARARAASGARAAGGA